MKYSILSFVFLMMISCSSKRELQNNEVIYYGKTACLGSCPVFDLYLFNDGKVIYEGFKNVEKKGKFVSSITMDKLKEIKNEISKIEFKAISNSKLKRDFPNTVIKVDGEKVTFQDTDNIKILEGLLKKIIPKN